LSNCSARQGARRQDPPEDGEKMKISYDPEVDVLSVLFNDSPIEESDEERPGLILDFDAEGNVVGIEVLNASMRVDNPLEYAAGS
jgi:uncharacterized protein YuzE